MTAHAADSAYPGLLFFTFDGRKPKHTHCKRDDDDVRSGRKRLSGHLRKERGSEQQHACEYRKGAERYAHTTIRRRRKNNTSKHSTAPAIEMAHARSNRRCARKASEMR